MHELKTTPAHFQDVAVGVKTVEVRRDDRGFRVGDELVLLEFGRPPGEDETRYTGQAIRVRVTHRLEGNGIRDGFVAMSIVRTSPSPSGTVTRANPEVMRRIVSTVRDTGARI